MKKAKGSDYSYADLLLNNKQWAHDKLKNDPEFFNKLKNLNKPNFFLIGCSDSKIHPNSLTGSLPGEIFIHRNIANIVSLTDFNFLTCLSYAVDYLKVKHVIVMGHYGCQSIKVSMTNISLGILDMWIKNIKDVYRLNRLELENYFDQDKKLDRLTELHVIEQVKNLAKCNIIQKSWKENESPHLHGWIYSLNDGLVKELITIKPNEIVDSNIYKYDV